jgi:hypothetical protein
MLGHVISAIGDHGSGFSEPISLGLAQIAWSVIVAKKESVNAEDSHILVYQARSSGIGDLSLAELFY